MAFSLLLPGAVRAMPGANRQTLPLPHLDGGGNRKRQQDDFGWWKSNLRDCRLLGPSLAPGRAVPVASPQQTAGCDQLRLDQQISGLLRISFLRLQHLDNVAAGKVVFVGLLEQGSQPMRCRQGRCEPRWPLRVRVSVVSEARFGPMGLVKGLPTTRLARGHCHLDYPLIHCRAASPDGIEWQAEARLRA